MMYDRLQLTQEYPYVKILSLAVRDGSYSKHMKQRC